MFYNFLYFFVLRKPLKLSKKDIADLWSIVVVVMKIYILFFFTAPAAIKAPGIDFKIAKALQDGKKLNPKIFNDIEKKFRSHLWYLTPENICFSLFDKDISLNTKNKMRINILNRESNDERVFRIDPETKLNNMEDLCTKKSTAFFEILGLSTSFLTRDASLWALDESFQAALSKVSLIISTNDIAERAVKISEDYNRCITKDSLQYEYICINAYETRKRFRKNK